MYDDFNSAPTIPASTTWQFHNKGNDVESGEPFHIGADVGATAWLKFVAPSTGDFTFHTRGSAIDTVLTIFRWDPDSAEAPTFDDLVEVGYNDDFNFGDAGPQFKSKVVVALTSGKTYYIQVGGFDTPPPKEGEIQLTVVPGDSVERFLQFVPVQQVTITQ